MSGIFTSEAVYMPCYHIDLSARKATLGKYNYTEMMKKAAQQTDDNITYYEPDEYGRVFVDPAHPSRATFESADTYGISLPDPNSARMPAVNTKAEEKARKKEERENQDEQARLLREERIWIGQLEAMLRKFGMPGYRMDFQSWTLTPDPNYFSDLLAKQAELSKTGESQLTQQEVEELSGKCDMNQMSSQEYKDFINYLADKGVIDRPKELEFDPGERIVIKGGQAWLESGEANSSRNTGTPGVARYLHPSLAEWHKKLLAEQAAAKVLQSTGRMDFAHSYRGD